MALDMNGDGTITYSDFLAAVTQGQGRFETEVPCNAFVGFDEVVSVASETEGVQRSLSRMPVDLAIAGEQRSHVQGEALWVNGAAERRDDALGVCSMDLADH